MIFAPGGQDATHTQNNFVWSKSKDSWKEEKYVLKWTHNWRTCSKTIKVKPSSNTIWRPSYSNLRHGGHLEKNNKQFENNK